MSTHAVPSDVSPIDDHGASHGNGHKKINPVILSWAWVVLLVFGLLIPTIGIYNTSFSEWLHSPTTGFSFAKVLTSLCWFLVGLTGVINAVVRIKDSEAEDVEWFGCVELVLSSMLLFATFVASSASPETFTSFQKLLVPSRKPAMEDKVTNLKYATVTPAAGTTPAVDSGEVSWDMDGTALWYVINVDYKNGEPVKRQSILRTHIDRSEKGRFTYTLDEEDRPKWERIGVFYATANGPSEEAVIFRKEDSASSSSGSAGSTGSTPAVTGTSSSGSATAAAGGSPASAGTSTDPGLALPIAPPLPLSVLTVPTSPSIAAPAATGTADPAATKADPTDPDDPDKTL